jgi:hypothetical protein
MPPRRPTTRLPGGQRPAALAAAPLLAGLLAALLAAPPALAAAPPAAPPTSPAGPAARCVACHGELQPGIVSDWRLSRHAAVDVGCDACHGTAHATAQDAARALHPSIATCQRCHELQASQYRRGEHARAWQAVKAIPTYHHFTDGRPGDQTGCAACHRLGLMSPQEAAAVDQGGTRHGRASCDACHTRHLFSPAEAREPEACKSCHGLLQYEAWAGSKHGIRHLLKRAGKLPASASAPTCQTCHMQQADHAIRVSRTNLALRLALVSDPLVAADKAVIYQALGALDASGGNGPRAAAMEAAGLAELDRVDPSEDRARLVNACRQCHATRPMPLASEISVSATCTITFFSEWARGAGELTPSACVAAPGVANSIASGGTRSVVSQTSAARGWTAALQAHPFDSDTTERVPPGYPPACSRSRYCRGVMPVKPLKSLLKKYRSP